MSAATCWCPNEWVMQPWRLPATALRCHAMLHDLCSARNPPSRARGNLQFVKAVCNLHMYAVLLLLVPAAPQLTVQPVVVTTAASTAVSGSMLAGVTPPAGATLSVTGLRLPGSAKPIAAGSSPVQVVDPITGKVTGRLAVRTDGTFTFTPAAGFAGNVPTVYVTVKSSNGQSKEAPLMVIVRPASGECMPGSAVGARC